MSSFASNFANTANKETQSIAENQTLDNILRRSQDNNANIDTLLLEAMKIREPNRRNSAINVLSERMKRDTELKKNQRQQTEINRILNSNDPQRELINSRELSFENKTKLGKFINEQLLTGGLNIGQTDQRSDPQQQPLNENGISEQQTPINESSIAVDPEQASLVNEIVQGDSSPDLTKPAYMVNGRIDFTKADDVDLGRLAQIYPQAVTNEQKRRDREQKSFVSDRDFNLKLADPFIKEINETRSGISEQEDLANLLIDAIETQDLGFWSLDNLANFVPEKFRGAFRTGKGKLFDSATKDFFIGDLGKIKGRPNQWIENQVLNAMARIGESREAQLMVAKSKLANIKLQSEKVKIYDRTVNEYMNSEGKVPFNLAEIVEAKLAPVRLEANQKLSYDIKVLDEQEKGKEKILQEINSGKRAVNGEPLTAQRVKLLSKKFKGDLGRVRNWAVDHGYRIPEPEQYERWTN